MEWGGGKFTTTQKVAVPKISCEDDPFITYQSLSFPIKV